MTTSKRQVEVFTAGCPACDETVQLVQAIVCESCEVTVLEMNNATVAGRAKEIGVSRVPAVVVNGQLAGCSRMQVPTRRPYKKPVSVRLPKAG